MLKHIIMFVRFVLFSSWKLGTVVYRLTLNDVHHGQVDNQRIGEREPISEVNKIQSKVFQLCEICGTLHAVVSDE